MLSGATGLIGSFLVDVILEKNSIDHLNCTVYTLGRNEDKAKKRFIKYKEETQYIFIPYDVKRTFSRNDIGSIEYVMHLASNTHPIQYSTDPIGTITTNIIGLKNMVDFATKSIPSLCSQFRSCYVGVLSHQYDSDAMEGNTVSCWRESVEKEA